MGLPVNRKDKPAPSAAKLTRVHQYDTGIVNGNTDTETDIQSKLTNIRNWRLYTSNRIEPIS